MAIAYDNSSASLSPGANYTIGSTNNFFFFVTDINSATPPTYTLGGVALTLITSTLLSNGSCGTNYEHYYYAVGIPAGSQLLTSPSGGGAGMASSYTGVNQSAPVTDLVSGNYNTSGPSTTPTNANSWVLSSSNACFNFNQSSSTITTYRTGTNGSGQRIVDSDGILSGSQSISNSTGVVSMMIFALNVSTHPSTGPFPTHFND